MTTQDIIDLYISSFTKRIYLSNHPSKIIYYHPKMFSKEWEEGKFPSDNALTLVYYPDGSGDLYVSNKFVSFLKNYLNLTYYEAKKAIRIWFVEKENYGVVEMGVF